MFPVAPELSFSFCDDLAPYEFHAVGMVSVQTAITPTVVDSEHHHRV